MLTKFSKTKESIYPKNIAKTKFITVKHAFQAKLRSA